MSAPHIGTQTVGTVMMGYPAYPMTTNASIVVSRDGASLSPFDMTYYPHENLTLDLFGAPGQVAWEASGGASFLTGGGCPGNIRSANRTTTIMMPGDDVSEVTVWGGCADGNSAVGIMRSVTLKPKMNAMVSVSMFNASSETFAAYITMTLVGIPYIEFDVPIARRLLSTALDLPYSQIYLVANVASPTSPIGQRFLRWLKGESETHRRRIQSRQNPVATDVVLRITNLKTQADASALLSPLKTFLTSPLPHDFLGQYMNATTPSSAEDPVSVVIRQSGSIPFSIPSLRARCVLDEPTGMALSWRLDPTLEFVDLQLEGAGKGWIAGGLVTADKLMVSRPRHKVLLYDFTAGEARFLSLEGYLPRNLVATNASAYGVAPLLLQAAGGKMFMRYRQVFDKAIVPVDLLESTSFMWAWSEHSFPEMHAAARTVLLHWADGTCSPPLILPALEGYWLLLFPFLAVFVTWTSMRKTNEDDCGRTLLQRRLGAILPLPAWVDEYTCGIMSDLLNLKWGEFLFIVLFYVLQGMLIVYWALRFGDFGLKSLGIAFGKAALTNLMLAFLPVSKTSVWVVIFGISFERAVKYHRHVSYLMLLTTTLHLAFLIGINPVWGYPPKLNGVVMAYGLWAYICFLVMAATALFRRWHFEIFRYTHYLFIAGTVLSILHVPEGLPYMWVPGILYVVDFFWRWVGVLRDPVLATLSVFPDRVTQLDVFPLTPGGPSNLFHKCGGGKERKWNRPLEPGSYVFVCIPRISLFQWHPISISTAGMTLSPQAGVAPSFSLHLKGLQEGSWSGRLCRLAEVARTREDRHHAGTGTDKPPASARESIRGWTGWLPTFKEGSDSPMESPRAQSQRSLFPSHHTSINWLSILVDGPYGKLSIDLRNYRRLMLVAGGIGVTPMTTTLSYISYQKRQQLLTSLQGVTLVWVSRSLDLMYGFAPFLGAMQLEMNTPEQPRFFEPELYVSKGLDASGSISPVSYAEFSRTGIVQQGAGSKAQSLPAAIGPDVEIGRTAEKSDWHEQGGVDGGGETGTVQGINTHRGRPNFEKILRNLVLSEKGESDAVGVLVCAPKALLLEVQRQCVIQDVDLHMEEFDW